MLLFCTHYWPDRDEDFPQTHGDSSGGHGENVLPNKTGKYRCGKCLNKINIVLTH